MTPEDKALIAEYMGWIKINSDNVYGREMEDSEDQICIIRYNLNDASLCVSRMVEKGDWEDFQIKIYFSDMATGLRAHEFVAWLFNADNFFQAMAEWLRQK